MRNYTYGDFLCNSVSVLYSESNLNSVRFLQQTTRRQRRENTENLKKKKKKSLSIWWTKIGGEGC